MVFRYFARLFFLGSTSLLGMATLTGCGSGGTISQPPSSPTPPSGATPVATQCKSTVTAPTKTHATNVTGPALSGKVLAGSQPIVGASVQLYIAGTTGNGSTPTAVFTAPLTTDSTGAFASSASYTCPFDNSSLYLVARGGKAGAATNNGTVLMTALGSCSAVNASSNLVVSEATTVAGAYSLAQFLGSGGNIGSSSTNASGVDLAANTAANLVNISTGQAPGVNFPTSTATAPSAQINTLANLLNACVVSNGPSSSACTELYSNTTAVGGTPSNTLDAIANLVRHPATNTAALFTLSGASSAYSPALTEAPSDWTLFVSYGGGGLSGPAAIAFDSAGNAWVTNYSGVVSEFTNTGSPVYPSGISGYNLAISLGNAVDVFDNVWIANQQSDASVNNKLGSVTVLSNTASSISGANYTAGGINYPDAVAIDTSGNYWFADYGDAHVTILDKTGASLSGVSGYTSSQLQFPVSVAVDSKCYGYVANLNTNTVTKLPPDGSSFTSFVVGGAASGPSAVAVDESDNVWAANYYGGSIGLISSTGSVLSGSGFKGGGIAYPEGVAIDGSGSAWITNRNGLSISQLAAASSATPGAALSPAVGWGPDANLDEAYGIAIDASGNIWVSNFGGATLTEFIGLATPVRTPLVGPVAVP